MATQQLSLTLVIPVYNEAAFLPGALETLFAELAGVDAAVDVILAENGSTDGTADVGRRLGKTYPNLRVIELPEPDYGGAS